MTCRDEVLVATGLLSAEVLTRSAVAMLSGRCDAGKQIQGQHNLHACRVAYVRKFTGQSLSYV